jgi:hypothetical protein
MIPVNMSIKNSILLEIGFHRNIRAELLDAQIGQRRLGHAWQVREWDSGFTGEFWSVEEH